VPHDQDANGATCAIAVPHHWNSSLVVHAHGGTDLNEEAAPQRSPDGEGHVLFCSPVRPGSCADSPRPDSSDCSHSWPGPFLEILADADYQGMGA
jgi:hypothetical protein